MIHDTAFIHPKSHVEGVTIGARTNVWQFSTVIRGTVLGDDCSVASNVTLDGPVFGHRCIVSPGVDIGPGFLIEDDVFIGPNVVLCNDMWPEAAKEGFNADWYRAGRVAVHVRRGASIGANAVVLPGVVIGEGAVVSAGAVVERDVPAGMLLRRNGYLSEVPSDRRARRMRDVMNRPAERRVQRYPSALEAAAADGMLVLDHALKQAERSFA